MRILLDDIEREIWEIEKADIPDLKGYLLIGDYPATHHIDEDPSYYAPRLKKYKDMTQAMIRDPKWREHSFKGCDRGKTRMSWYGVDDVS